MTRAEWRSISGAREKPEVGHPGAVGCYTGKNALCQAKGFIKHNACSTWRPFSPFLDEWRKYCILWEPKAGWISDGNLRTASGNGGCSFAGESRAHHRSTTIPLAFISSWDLRGQWIGAQVLTHSGIKPLQWRCDQESAFIQRKVPVAWDLGPRGCGVISYHFLKPCYC